MTNSTEEKTQMNGVATFNFGHLDISNKTAQYPLSIIADGVWVEGRPAMVDVNDAYKEALLGTTGKREQMRKRYLEGNINVDDDDMEREEDYVMFALSIITAWHGVRNVEGKLVPFSKKNVEQFLRALPTWVFDRIRLYFKFPDTFITKAEQPPTDVDGISGNS